MNQGPIAEYYLTRAFCRSISFEQMVKHPHYAEFEVSWPALVAYIKQSEARAEKMRSDVLFALGEGQGGPSIEKIVWYMLDRAVRMSTKSGP